MEELSKINAKLDMIVSMRMHSKATRTEQSLSKYSDTKFDCGDHEYSYVTPPTLIEDSKKESVADESVVEVTSPKPKLLRMKKRAHVLKTPYTDSTKRRKYRKGDGTKFNPFRATDPYKLEA